MVNLFYHARYINLITFANTNLSFGLGDLSSSKFNAASKVYVNLRNIPYWLLDQDAAAYGLQIRYREVILCADV
jgi:hypothetical protein